MGGGWDVWEGEFLSLETGGRGFGSLGESVWHVLGEPIFSTLTYQVLNYVS